VLFGGIYDWYDPMLAIDAVAIARAEVPGLTLTFTRHPNPAITPQGKSAETLAYVARKGYEDFILFEPWAPYDSRGAFFDSFAAALLTFPRSLETDLAMRTRVYDYLWGALPIVSSSAPGTDELIVRHDVGRIVDGDAAAYARALVDVLQQRDEYAQRTREFVDAHQWARTLEPLREFCNAPRVDADKNAFAADVQPAHRSVTVLDRIKRRIGASF
jgi:glycosyltransferase involved in cell wall biosynthesis